ncbi:MULTISPECIES: antitoxin TumA [unclassified Thiocapsa]|uniref:antitoxin TumA n=1 Tax=unclassified Thiocapsa TaxID=2641286 RepID=UPI0035B1E004
MATSEIEVDEMRKETITFESPLEALVAVEKRLSRCETEAGMDSADFFARYEKGESDDDARSVDWANDYRHFLALHHYLEERLHEAA